VEDNWRDRGTDGCLCVCFREREGDGAGGGGVEGPVTALVCRRPRIGSCVSKAPYRQLCGRQCRTCSPRERRAPCPLILPCGVSCTPGLLQCPIEGPFTPYNVDGYTDMGPVTMNGKTLEWWQQGAWAWVHGAPAAFDRHPLVSQLVDAVAFPRVRGPSLGGCCVCSCLCSDRDPYPEHHDGGWCVLVLVPSHASASVLRRAMLKHLCQYYVPGLSFGL
jgi:hypothetical protein